MTTVIWNGKPRPADEASLSPKGDGVQFGAGVFTTVRVRGGRAELLPQHLARLRRDAVAIGLTPPDNATGLLERIGECTTQNAIEQGGVKVVWLADREGRTAEWIAPRPHGYGPEQVARGFRLQTRGCEVREQRTLIRHKTTNYLEHLIAKRAALSAGFDEALWINERGEVLEGATTNLFLVRHGELITPPVESGLLPGVVRACLLDERRFPRVRVARVSRGELLSAEEVFVTNALAGVMPVRAVDEHVFDWENNPVTRRVAEVFDEVSRSA
jgi:branched-subunit amino acid aminotransferase/4-amino-4-deoxychorismate lyase